MKLDFDAESHQYKIDGRPVPGVTGLLDSLCPAWKVDDWFLARGTATHLACQYADAGTLDWDSVSAEIRPRVDAWMKFREAYPAEVVANELMLGHSVYQYCGRIDRVFRVGSKLCLVDLKNSVTPRVRLQLSAYALLHEDNGLGTIHNAAAVELLSSGNFKCMWLNAAELKREKQYFLAGLTWFGWLKKNKMEGNAHE